MKRNITLSALMLSVSFALLLIPNCGKTRQTVKTDIEVAAELVQILNEAPGLTIKSEPANIIVEPSEKNRYLITLKDPVIGFDISKFNMGIPIKDTKIPVKLKEVVFKYGPGEKYLQLVSVRELFLDWDFSGFIKTAGEAKDKPGLPGMAIKISMGKAAFKNYNISPLLDTKTKDLMELVGEFLEKNQSPESVAEHITYEFGFLSKEQEKISILLDIEKIESHQKALSDIFISLYKKGRELPDFSKMLTQGKPLLDLEMSSSLVKLTVKENENVLGSGTVDKISFSYFLKPDETNSFFIYGFTWDMKYLKVSVPNNKEIELAGNIDEWGMKLSLENLTAPFVKSYFDLVKKNLEMSAAMDKEKLQQQQMMMGLTIASEFMKSKPTIKFSISPFKHHFGELEAAMNFKFLNLMAPPVGKAVVNIPKIDEILTKIAGEKSLSQKTREVLLKLAKKYVPVDENGNGAITFETRQDQPGTFFLNGKPIK
ncbi:hypothetical protein ACFLRT_04060 [Acidobacteriota bacterium]